MAESVLDELQSKIESFTIIPSGGGRFEVSLNGDLVYSKLSTGKFPEPDEIKKVLKAKL